MLIFYKGKRCIAVCNKCHRYGNSRIIWNHTVLLDTRQRWLPRLYSSQLKLVILDGCKLSWPGWFGYIPRWYTRPKSVMHACTNRAQRRRTTVPLCLTGMFKAQQKHVRNTVKVLVYLIVTECNTHNTQSFYCCSEICPGLPGWASTRTVIPGRVKPIWIYWSKW